MPKPLTANWELLRSAYLQGTPLREIARQSGVNYHALRARALRHHWKADAAAGAAMMQHAVGATMEERGRNWTHQMADLVEKRLAYLQRLDPSKLKLKELKELTEITDLTDRTARRTFGLDHEGGNGPVLNIALLQLPNREDLRQATAIEVGGDESSAK